MNTGERIKRARKNAGLSQKELGEKLEMSPVMISQYENGKRKPKLDTLLRISNALSCSIGDLNPDWSQFSIDEIKKGFFDSATLDEKIENYLLEKEIDSIDGLINFLSFYGVSVDKNNMNFIFDDTNKKYHVKDIGLLSDISAAQIKILIQKFAEYRKEDDPD